MAAEPRSERSIREGAKVLGWLPSDDGGIKGDVVGLGQLSGVISARDNMQDRKNYEN
jgi:hypothetical protein